jgi:hypothetical protein
LAIAIGGEKEGRVDMRQMIVAGMFLALAALLPARPAAAQDPVAGAIVGGAIGGIIGGAVGRGAGGAVAGAVIGATTGAVIASEAQQRRGGYYWWRGGCYYRYPNGSWLQVAPGYC